MSSCIQTKRKNEMAFKPHPTPHPPKPTHTHKRITFRKVASVNKMQFMQMKLIQSYADSTSKFIHEKT